MTTSPTQVRNSAADEKQLRLQDNIHSLDRRRWYERLIMVPVSLGMLAAFAGDIAFGAIDKLGWAGILPAKHEDANIAFFSAGAALFGLLAEVFHRRALR